MRVQEMNEQCKCLDRKHFILARVTHDGKGTACPGTDRDGIVNYTSECVAKL